MRLSKRAIDWVEKARACTACPIHGHQAPPVAFVGQVYAPVLVFGQNPGQIKHTDTERLELAKRMCDTTDPVEYLELYRQDFKGSYADRRLGRLFGPDWLSSNKFLYSNVVLCRTYDNVVPYDTTVKICWEHNIGPLVKLWAESGSKGKLAVLMGGLAAYWTDDIEAMGIPVLRIPHYVTWNRMTFERIKSEWQQSIAKLNW